MLIALTVKQTLQKGQKGFTLFGVFWLLSIVPSFSLSNWLFHHSLGLYAINVNNTLLWDLLDFLPMLPLIWYVFIGPACLVLGTRKTELTPRFTRLAMILTTLITLCMSVVLSAMLYLALELLINAPQLNALYTILVQDVLVLCMALLILLCASALWRGWQAQHKLKLG